MNFINFNELRHQMNYFVIYFYFCVLFQALLVSLSNMYRQGCAFMPQVYHR
jgi:hypothetical protein